MKYKKGEQYAFSKIQLLIKKLTLCVLAFFLAFSPVLEVFAQEINEVNVNTQISSEPIPDVSQNVLSEVLEETSPRSIEQNPELITLEEEITTPKEEILPEEIKVEEPTKEVLPETMSAMALSGTQGNGLQFKLPTQPQASVDESTGALVYKYQIEVPEGRNGMTPELSLSYNSRNYSRPDSLLGLGWEMSIPFIVREPVKGTNNLYSKGFFSSSLSGNLISTTDNSSSQYTVYRPESDNGEYFKYTYNSDNTWTMTGKDGRTYTFGGTVSSRQDNPGNTSQVYKWMISKISDTQGNEIQYSYVKDNGQIYPSQIVYTYHPSAPAIHTVDFTYINPVGYGSTVYNAGFPVTTYKLLSNIVVTTNDGTYITTDTYNLNHQDAQFLKQKLFIQVLRVYVQGGYEHSQTFSDTTYFDYSTRTAGFETGTHSLAGYYNNVDDNIYGNVFPGDFDGNSFTDLIQIYSVGNTKYNYLLLNNGSTFSNYWTNWGLPDQHMMGHYAIVDVNGDSLPDLYPYSYGSSEPHATYINNGSGFNADSSGNWEVGTYIPEAMSCSPNTGDKNNFRSNVFLFDINNDKKNDLLYFGGSSDFRVFLNNGNGFTQSSAYTFTPGPSFSITHCTEYLSNNSFQTLLDINGDGLLDYFHKAYGTYLNTGSGFEHTSSYGVDLGDSDRSGFADINGDGLIDYVGFATYDSGNRCSIVNINNGQGFTKVNPSVFPPCNDTGLWNPVELKYTNNYPERFGALMDITADGFPDIVGSQMSSVTGKLRAINNGKNAWVLNPDPDIGGNDYWTPMVTPAYGLYLDVNNDNILDWITPNALLDGVPIPTSKTLMGKQSIPNILTKITNPFGAQTVVTYGTSGTDYSDINSTPLTVVKKLATQNIGQGQPDQVKQFNYDKGVYVTDTNTGQKRFAGFHKVVVSESGADLNTVRINETYYHQANGSDSATNEPVDTSLAQIGKPYYSIVKNPTGIPKREAWNKYGSYTLVTEPAIGRKSEFIYPTESVTKTTDNSGTLGIAEVYTFDVSLGEQTEKRDIGFVNVNSDGSYTDVVGDTRYEFTEYANNPTLTIVKPKRIDLRITPSSTDTISRIDYFYDNQTHGSIGSLGNLTKETKWISGNGATLADTNYTYDSFGNILNVTNPRGANTTYTYNTEKEKVATETNHLNHVTNYEYKTGKLSKVTDPNGRITTYGYTRQGLLYHTGVNNTGGTQNAYNYLAQDNNGVWFIEKSLQAVNSTEEREYQVFDNLGRKTRLIKRKLNHDDLTLDGYWLYQVNSYDALGRLVSTSAPYGTSASSYTNHFTNSIPSNLVTTTNLDVLDRPISIVNALGSTTLVYAGNETTTIDANNKQKKVKTDASGNLIEVKEYNGASVYTTSYEYDTRNLLTKVTDALSNVRNFVYNNTGWVTSSEDVHALADGTFSTTTFTYDLNGNQLTETKPDGVVVTRVYDMLDRPTSVDGSNTGATDYTITYDSCTNGKGRICTVSGTLPNSVTMNKSYVYGISGVPTSSTLTTLGNSYTTNYQYNYSDEVKQATYPNGTIFRYAFGYWAKPYKIYVTTPGGSESLFATTDYHFTQKPSTVTITNGGNTITHTYTYDDTKLYRLTRKQASSPAGSPTTVVFYPSSGDGRVSYNNLSWDLAHDSTSGNSANSVLTFLSTSTNKTSSGNFSISRVFTPFDTTSLPDNANITSVKLKLYVLSIANQDNDGDDWITIIQSSQPSTTSLSTADYDLAGAINNPIEGIDTGERKDITNIATGAYLTFNLNSTGRGWVNKTGFTKLGLREGHDVIDSPFGGANNQSNFLTVNSSEATGTTTDPILEVTYSAGGGTYQDSQYTYDNTNNVTQITEPTIRKNYTYDDLYRLTQAVHTPLPTGTATTYTYAYNAIGNVTTGGGSAYTYSGSNKTNPHAVTSIGANIYTYDDNGNMLTAPNLAITNNWQNQPTRITLNGTTNIDAYYDEQGERFIYQTPTNTEVQVEEDYIVRNSIPEIGLRLGGTTIGTISNGAIYSSITDHLGTPIKQVNSSGTVSEDVTYNPFGKVLTQSGTLNTKRGYTGHEEDIDTGLVYAEARYYNPSTLRFSQQDPSHIYLGHQNFIGLVGVERNQILLDPQQLNSYSYVRNNPINFTDPTGKILTKKQRDSVKSYFKNLFGSAFGGKKQSDIPKATQVKVGSVDYGEYKISSGPLRNKIEQFANQTNQNVIVVGGDRTLARNQSVGGAKRSRHLDGDAADIKVTGKENEQLSYEANQSNLFNTVIYYPKTDLLGALPPHVHVDLNPSNDNILMKYSPYMVGDKRIDKYLYIKNPLLSN